MARALVLLGLQVVLVYLVLGSFVPGINAVVQQLAVLLGGLQ